MNPLLENGEKLPECQFTRNSPDKQTLERHSLVQSEERPLCTICGKSFSNKSSLKRHSVIHSGERPHVCNSCGKSFYQICHLRTHSLLHSGEKPHVCNICGISFAQISNLKSHALYHSGEKPHVCKICGKSFTGIGNLKRHSLYHSGEKPHVCKICGKSFTNIWNLKSHSLIHSGERPHVCNSCGKSFSHICRLRTHSLLHSGEKPHVCNICGKSFTWRGDMKKHSLTHSGEKPHVCKICGKSFKLSKSLEKHTFKVCVKSYSKDYLKKHSCIHSAGNLSKKVKVTKGLKAPISNKNVSLASGPSHIKDVKEESLEESLIYGEGTEYSILEQCKREGPFSCSTLVDHSNASDLSDNTQIKEEVICCDEIVKEEHDIDYEEAAMWHMKKESDSDREEGETRILQEEEAELYAGELLYDEAVV